MSACLGVRAGWVDATTFALGAGLAGLAGCALTQIGNVGPSLGQNYIVDSFMVVVTGGVGKLAGTILAAAGIGGLNKGIEPALGAVFAKVAILIAVILFLQRRPAGLFAHTGAQCGSLSRSALARRRADPGRRAAAAATCCRRARRCTSPTSP